MVRQAIEERRRHLLVAEDTGPFAEGEVGGHDHRGRLLEPTNQMEQELSAGLGEGQIAEFIQHDEIDAHQPISQPALATKLRLGLELVHKIDGVEEPRLSAAADAGATGWQTLWHVVIPLTKPGIMIGTIFVVTLVMGDFITVRFMSGSQSANVGRMIQNDIGLLQYPSASATAVILLITVLMVIGLLLRLVDIRKEL